MSKEVICMIIFALFFAGCLAAAGTETLIARTRYRRQLRQWQQQAAERKWRADFFKRYRFEISPEDKP